MLLYRNTQGFHHLVKISTSIPLVSFQTLLIYELMRLRFHGVSADQMLADTISAIYAIAQGEDRPCILYGIIFAAFCPKGQMEVLLKLIFESLQVKTAQDALQHHCQKKHFWT